jgi:transcriptional regulator with XRE-family HTH domain
VAAGWRERLIEAVRKDRRTMNRISKEAGLSRNVVSQMINDHKDPGVPTLLRLCETLGVSPVWVILGRREDRYTEEFLQLLGAVTPERRREIVNALRSLLPPS